MSEGLPGPSTVKTPFGTVKKTNLYIGGSVVVIMAILYYRSQQSANAAAVAASGQSEINPATGYPYGSPEDAAALQHQAVYMFPTGVGSGGGGSAGGAYPPGTGFVTNAAWVQAVIEYMVSHDLVVDPGPLSVALGKYITGAPPTDEEKSLISQAIAAQGYPPIAGPSGYPPAINTATPTPPDDGGGDGGGGTTPTTVDVIVKGSWHVDQWIMDYRRQFDPTLTYEALAAQNPSIGSNIVWHTNSALNTFKHDAKYTWTH
jgi:hypothetical protein